VGDVSRLLDFYKKALGATEVYRMDGPDGKVVHTEIAVGDSRVMLSGECPDKGWRSPGSLSGNDSSLYIYVPDVDAAFNRAVQAGGKVMTSLSNMFWGDRTGEILDPSGHRWWLASRIENLTPQQIADRAEAFFAATAKAG
jgi:PhnB protein